MLRKISGEACVRALLRAGFEVQQRGHGFSFLRRDRQLVMVPDVEELSEDMLQSIGRSAGVSPLELARPDTRTPSRSRLSAARRSSFLDDAPPSSQGH